MQNPIVSGRSKAATPKGRTERRVSSAEDRGESIVVAAARTQSDAEASPQKFIPAHMRKTVSRITEEQMKKGSNWRKRANKCKN